MDEKAKEDSKDLSAWRRRVHDVIFEADTFAGKLFDVVLLIAIALSVLAVMLETIESIDSRYKVVFSTAELIFTILFTIEYILRLCSVKQPLRYACSFFGVIDLLSIIPTYLALFMAGNDAQYLINIRIFRLLRLFRIFKMARYIGGGNLILMALRASRAKIIVFLFAVLTMAVIMGTIMYVVEGGENQQQFSSIPQSTYWAIVTITTVGYGDIAPITVLGKFLASFAMLSGYAIIAVPTGIVGAEINRQMKKNQEYSNQSCTSCGAQVHTADARYCRLCGEKLELS
ncbi:MAG: voltage-gated potassium channel [Verrucomicrobiales bacterium]|jgi:voltage-gated potassium channel